MLIGNGGVASILAAAAPDGENSNDDADPNDDAHNDAIPEGASTSLDLILDRLRRRGIFGARLCFQLLRRLCWGWFGLF